MRPARLISTLDWFQLIGIIILLIFGIAILFGFSFPQNQSPSLANSLAWTQLFYAVLGLILLVVMTFFDYRTWQGLAWWLYLAGAILLILVPVWGTEVFGAKRWIDIGFFKFQPSEIVKIFFIILVARFLAEREHFTLKHLIYLLVILALPVLLILAQPDLGTASVFGVIFLAIMLVAKIPRYWWLIFGGLIVLIIPVVWLNLKAYQKERILSYRQGTSYNLTQAKIAIGSGGLTGRGIGQGTQSQLNFLPVAYSDFIFAGIAEATGLVGSVLLIGVLLVLVWRCLRTAQVSQDEFGRYFSVGLASLILYQMFINIGGNLGLVPITGIPLPLVSFGGTSLISYLAGLGIVQSIYLRHKKLSFE